MRLVITLLTVLLFAIPAQGQAVDMDDILWIKRGTIPQWNFFGVVCTTAQDARSMIGRVQAIAEESFEQLKKGELADSEKGARLAKELISTTSSCIQIYFDRFRVLANPDPKIFYSLRVITGEISHMIVTEIEPLDIYGYPAGPHLFAPLPMLVE